MLSRIRKKKDDILPGVFLWGNLQMAQIMTFSVDEFGKHSRKLQKLALQIFNFPKARIVFKGRLNEKKNAKIFSKNNTQAKGHEALLIFSA